MLLTILLSCRPTDTPEERRWEGQHSGECDDGADNDGDGAFDCFDDDCAGAQSSPHSSDLDDAVATDAEAA